VTYGPLIDLWMAHARGEPAEQRATREGPPPHLQGVEWTYHCPCGCGWRAMGDAEWHDGAWRGRAVECVGCHQWIRGTY
jgi:hypothetical protein